MKNYFHIKRASYLGDFKIHLEFENNEQKILDCSSWLNEDMGDFEDIKKEENFRQFDIKRGLLVWPNGYDLAPEYSYQNSKSFIFDANSSPYTFRLK